MSNVKNIKGNASHGFKLKIDNVKKRAQLDIYGEIGDNIFGDGITLANISEELKAIKNVKEIDVRINSMGGDAFQGIAIYNRLKQYDASIKVYVDGIAASAASIIAMAGDEIIMGTGSLLMIHSPMTMSFGNQRDLQETIEVLDTVEDQMLDIYQKVTGKDRLELRRLVQDETWMGADEAIELGFATQVEETMPVAACAKSTLAKFKKVFKNCPTERIVTETQKVKDDIKNKLKNIEDYLAR